MPQEQFRVVVGVLDNDETTNYGREVELSGGLAEQVASGAISKLRWNPPTNIEIAGARTDNCVPQMIIAAFDVLRAQRVTVNLYKCRRDENDLGDENNLKERKHDIEKVLGKKYSKLHWNPDVK